ncbi:amidohydrolase [Lysinibacillus parviboronicapiens]|uniref:amidohydrolase n=1 Tax=Lysinibacillus parviboronicapiens TaxID=436516 RepID=UPI000D3C679F|nr:amidohydrolase [Lysinibacillus parviboronicapiens]
MNGMKEKIDHLLKQYKQDIIDLADRIWDIAETRFEEYESVHVLTSYLKSIGFEVEVGIAGLPTAFIASYGTAGPVIGILGEYDALPRLNQKSSSPIREATVEGGNGHGCGHNLLGTAGVAAVAVLKDLIVAGELTGTIRYYGCPAEEGGSGKTFMVREGVFDDVDIALTWHPNSFTSVFSFSSLANYQVYFEFEGVAAHAANSPHLGRSALDAVELMNVGVNYLREHITTTARVHYAVTDTGGMSPNVVQSHAKVLYLIRAKNIKEVDGIYQRIVKIAQGASLMTETNVTIKFDKACSNYLPNDTINKIIYEKLQKVGLPHYTNEEMAYAVDMHHSISPHEMQSAKEEIKLLAGGYAEELALENVDTPFYEKIVPYTKSNLSMAGSTDVADVSWVVPTAQFFTTCFVLGTPLHTWQLVSQGKTALGHKGMLYAGKVMALTAIDLLQNEQLIVEAKREHAKQTNHAYKNPIPKEVKPNMFGS